jgi:hypothetical protein
MLSVNLKLLVCMLRLIVDAIATAALSQLTQAKMISGSYLRIADAIVDAAI